MEVLRPPQEGLKGLVTAPGNGKRPPLGALLLERGLVTPEQLDAALAEQRRTRQRLGRILVDRGVVGRRPLLEALAAQLGVPFVDLAEGIPDEDLARRLPEWAARRYRMVPVARRGDRTVVAMADPTDLVGLETARMFVKDPVPAVALDADVDAAIARLYGPLRRALDLEESERAAPRLVISRERDAFREDEGGEAVLNALLEEAARIGPTDIHLDPQPGAVRVRFRVDGVLVDVARLPRDQAEAAISRLKVLADMDISERTRPQDGRLTASVMGLELDLRVATLGTQWGERASLRILNPHRVLLGLRDLGMLPEQVESVRAAAAMPHGLVLITGPTGSGKTTTLYAILRELASPDKHVVSVEDPVEYRLDGVTQIPVREKAGLDFPTILRAVLRHDPDVIVVGEVRDPQSMEIAAQAALTGHLVLATMHASSPQDALVRIREMGTPEWLLSASVVCAVNQRLVRRLCTCRGAGGNGGGCVDCLRTGYRGRTGLFAVHARDPSGSADWGSGSASVADSLNRLWEAAERLMDSGITDYDEVVRVLGPRPKGP